MFGRVASVALALLIAGSVTAVSAAAVASAAAPAAPPSVSIVSRAPGSYVPLDPARVLDTRSGNGAAIAPVLPGRTLDLAVLGRGGLPTEGVAAVVLTLTVTDTASTGFVSAFPGGASAPLTSSLNFVAGQTVANQVTVALGPHGDVGLRVGGTTRAVSLVADVSGWYRAGAPAAAGTFIGETPRRLLDTRQTGDALTPASAAVLPVAGHGGVPATGVSAVVVNLTVADPTSAGFLTAFPTGPRVPLVSSLNVTPGRTVANQATVPLAGDGSISLYAGATTAPLSVVVDVTGWYLGGTPDVAGAFVPVRPTRTVDTRLPGNDAYWNGSRVGGDLIVPLGSELGAIQPGVPADRPADTVLANLTVTNTAGSGVLTAWPERVGGPPTTSVLNWDSAATVAAQATPRLGEGGEIHLSQSRMTTTADVVVDVVGYFIATPPPPVTNLRATVTAHTVTLSWDTTAEAPGVFLDRRGVDGPSPGRFYGYHNVMTSICMNDVEPGTTYDYGLLAATPIPIYSTTSTDVTVTTPATDPPGTTAPC